MPMTKYESLKDHELARETEKRYKMMKALLLEIRDLLREASGLE